MRNRNPDGALRTLVAASLLALAVTACGGRGGDPAATADKMTHALYANDYDTFVSYFDDATKPSVTRASVGALSDKLHQLGDLGSQTAVDADADKGRYRYSVTLSKGTALIELRVDPTGKVGAFRIVPPQS